MSGSLEEGFQPHTGRSAAHYLLRRKLTLSNVKQTKQRTIDICIRSHKEHRACRIDREKQQLDFNINKSIFSLKANNLSTQNNETEIFRLNTRNFLNICLYKINL